MADVPRGTPPGDIVLAVLAALPDLGNALTMTADGDAVVRLQVPPQFTSDVAAALQQLRSRTFYLCIVAKPHVQKNDGSNQTPNRSAKGADTSAPAAGRQRTPRADRPVGRARGKRPRAD